MSIEKFAICVLFGLWACFTLGCKNRNIPSRFVPNQSKFISFVISNDDGDEFRFSNAELRRLEKIWGEVDNFSKFSQAQWDAFYDFGMQGSAKCSFLDGLEVHCDRLQIGKVGSKLLMIFNVPESEWSDDPCPVRAYLDSVIVDDRLIELEQFIEKSRGRSVND